jgi:hypothetical protein
VVQSIQTTFQPGSKNTLSGLYRSVATGQNGSVINSRDSTLNPMIAVQTFGATSVCCSIVILRLSLAGAFFFKIIVLVHSAAQS